MRFTALTDKHDVEQVDAVSHDIQHSQVFLLFAVNTGIVLGTIFAGGTLISSNEMSPGDLMSFLVASQTVQR